MPIVSVERSTLFKYLDNTFGDPKDKNYGKICQKAFEELCFDFGIELEFKKNKEAQKQFQELSSEIVYKIDIPANRYDLLSVEGLSLALRLFTNKSELPKYTLTKPVYTMTVKKETALIRPYIVCAVLRDVTLDEVAYKSFIKLQEKLHFNACRKRSLVAIGTHDLDTLSPDFTYEARPPKEIKFRALKEEKEMDMDELFEYYEKNSAIKQVSEYCYLLTEQKNDPKVYPVIYDSKRTVLSLPPIINGQHSAMSTKTRNIFIESTATDITRAHIVLNIIVSLISQYCDKPFTIEPVKVHYEATGKTDITPHMFNPQVFKTSTDFINAGIGVDLSGSEIQKLCKRMMLECKVAGKEVTVTVPPMRSDILHPVDIVEDVGIAYGYNNIPKTIPDCLPSSKILPINKYTDLLRENVAQAGFIEVLTWALVSKKENFDFLMMKNDGKTAVEIANPKTAEFEVCRTQLLAGMLKTLNHNYAMVEKPIHLFEVGDVVVLDSSEAVGAKNCRKFCALVASGRDSGFEEVHGLLDRIMEISGVLYYNDLPPKEKKKHPSPYVLPKEVEAKESGVYKSNEILQTYGIKKNNCPAYFKGRRADVWSNGRVIGRMGIVDPQVAENFGLSRKDGVMVSALELDIEPFIPFKSL